jgi:hypothetical protein
MKTVTCEVCNAPLSGEDFEAWFKAAHTHWQAEHTNKMKEMQGQPNAEEEKAKWMVEAKRKFAEAPEA